jgi:hypothetical protein
MTPVKQTIQVFTSIIVSSGGMIKSRMFLYWFTVSQKKTNWGTWEFNLHFTRNKIQHRRKNPILRGLVVPVTWTCITVMQSWTLALVCLCIALMMSGSQFTAYLLPLYCQLVAFTLPTCCLYVANSLPLCCLLVAFVLPLCCCLQPLFEKKPELGKWLYN